MRICVGAHATVTEKLATTHQTIWLLLHHHHHLLQGQVQLVLLDKDQVQAPPNQQEQTLQQMLKEMVLEAQTRQPLEGTEEQEPQDLLVLQTW